MPGIFTSEAEVTHVSKHGFWLLLDAEELLALPALKSVLREAGP